MDLSASGKHGLRASDDWLRLNQDGAFTAGVQTPGLFAPVSLNVGGVNGWQNPGPGNAWVAGRLGIGTVQPVHVAGGAVINGVTIGADGNGVDYPYEYESIGVTAPSTS